jgi:hypothetical protein
LEGKISEAFEKESEASKPFAQGGEHVGAVDVTMDGGVPTVRKPNQHVSDLSPLLFGAVPNTDFKERLDTKKYSDAMSATYSAEKKGRAQDAMQIWEDQDDVKMPIMPDEHLFRRAQFANGYWGAEMAKSKPTSKSKSGKTVSFDKSADRVPEEQRDPNRTFAQETAKHALGKQRRQEKLKEAVAKYRTDYADDAEFYTRWGAQTHAASPMLAEEQASADQQPLIEEADQEPLIKEEE